MLKLEKVGYEVEIVEVKANNLQRVENLDMYVDGIFQMLKYSTEDSGLPYDLWFDDVGKDRFNKHKAPRVKVELPNRDLLPLSIEEEPKLLLKGVPLAKAEKELQEIDESKMKRIHDFIFKNHQLILHHWNGEIDDFDLVNNLQTDFY
jgi:hypothetical protein